MSPSASPRERRHTIAQVAASPRAVTTVVSRPNEIIRTTPVHPGEAHGYHGEWQRQQVAVVNGQKGRVLPAVALQKPRQVATWTRASLVSRVIEAVRTKLDGGPYAMFAQGLLIYAGVTLLAAALHLSMPPTSLMHMESLCVPWEVRSGFRSFYVQAPLLMGAVVFLALHRRLLTALGCIAIPACFILAGITGLPAKPVHAFDMDLIDALIHPRDESVACHWRPRPKSGAAPAPTPAAASQRPPR